ncbi:CUE domain-containing protein 1 [Lycorma delicatula]|uniref:CUE domain-containing protein 1 n=1 Tax=Lycorma delicatula TaxID=130591 RepID=UPI003F512BF2
MATVQQTTQLEFHQAMADFKTMFPAMDDDVIEAVLRSNQGAVDATIDQLLSMTTDNENDKIRHQLDIIDSDQQLIHDGQDDIDALSVHQQSTNMISTTTVKQLPAPSSKISSPSASPKIVDDGNLRLKDNTAGSPISVPETGVTIAVDNGTSSISSVATGISDVNNSTPLRQRRGWVPPLLGPLPDDFLRLTPTTCSPSYVAGLNKPQTEGELEDERIALFLQNEEFMAELRWNKDFLLMLDKDSPPEERLSSFPQSRSTDDDAVFKERLRNMGKMSRKKFSQLARVFTGRKKRSSAKQILTQGPAPSRDNLLLQEEDSDGT